MKNAKPSLRSRGRWPRLLALPLWATLAACAAPPAPPASAPAGERAAIALGQEFSLTVGASVGLAGGWRVGFDGVDNDSRCPRGEQCITAGDASVRLWVQPPAQPRQAVVLHTSPTLAQTATAAGLAVQLLHLQPIPTSGRVIPPAAYVATLRALRDTAPKDPTR